MTKKKDGLDRRGFLRAASLGAGATAATAPFAAAPAAAETGDQRTKARYKESAHVKRFYETNRYPAGTK